MRHRKYSFKFRQSFLWLLLFLPLFTFSQQEQVEHIDALVQVDKSGDIVVTETITIFSQGDVFKRGIVRELPNYREDKFGERIRMRYDIQSVKKDGSRSNYHTENSGGNLQIYVGDKNIFLDRGKSYQYELKYRVEGQIGFFEDRDEIYWNAVGPDWVVPIQSATAAIQLPEGAEEIESSCYTGAYGSTTKDCEINVEGSIITFKSNDVGQGKGLTVATGFTKGIVYEPPPPPPPTPPTFLQKFGGHMMTALFAGILLFYYFFTWRKFGIDPPKPTVYPQFDAPDNLSPASIGLLKKGHYWNDLLTASIVNLAVKGYIKINEEETKGFFGMFKDKEYELEKLKDAGRSLPKEERVVMQKLFGSGWKKTIDGEYDKEIESLVKKYRGEISGQWRPLLREGNNLKFWIFPLLTTGFYFFSFVFLLGYFKNPYLPFIFFGFLFINLIFFLFYQWLIRKPAAEKLRLRSEIEGLKMYLSAAEEKQLQHFNPPSLTPEIFEKFLPYAIALNTDEIWGKKFQSILDASGMSEKYESSWTNYSGGSFGNFSHAMNSSLSNSLAHSSVQPSSSSSGGGWSGGSGGGGFSGGGGGGGGGGGW